MENQLEDMLRKLCRSADRLDQIESLIFDYRLESKKDDADISYLNEKFVELVCRILEEDIVDELCESHAMQMRETEARSQFLDDVRWQLNQDD